MSASVFPARAGMSRGTRRRVSYPHCVPRASGDEPKGAAVLVEGNECSPRERG